MPGADDDDLAVRLDGHSLGGEAGHHLAIAAETRVERPIAAVARGDASSGDDDLAVGLDRQSRSPVAPASQTRDDLAFPAKTGVQHDLAVLAKTGVQRACRGSDAARYEYCCGDRSDGHRHRDESSAVARATDGDLRPDGAVQLAQPLVGEFRDGGRREQPRDALDLAALLALGRMRVHPCLSFPDPAARLLSLLSCPPAAGSSVAPRARSSSRARPCNRDFARDRRERIVPTGTPIASAAWT